MAKEAKRAAKLEKKLKILLGGYMVSGTGVLSLHTRGASHRPVVKPSLNNSTTHTIKSNKLLLNWRHSRNYN